MSTNDEARDICGAKLLELLRDLLDPEFDSERSKDELKERLSEIYLDKDGATYRHHYSDVSRFLYESRVGVEECTWVIETLRAVRDSIDDGRLWMCTDKLIDHITLESIRIGQMDTVRQQAAETSRAIGEAKELVSQAEQMEKRQRAIQLENETQAEEIRKEKVAVKSMLEEVRTHNIQTVATLSIFSCIVFAFTGGFTIIGNSLSTISSIKSDNAPFFLACIILLALLMYDVIHMLLYYTSKLTGTKATDRNFSLINGSGLLAVLVLLVIYYMEYH